MDERSPLDNRSLSHTSREPEGQAWAQIGTKSPATAVKAVAAASTAGNSQSTATSAAEKEASPPPPPSDAQTRSEEDALSDDGRPLQVVEDAESEPPPATHEAAPAGAEEKKNGDGEDAPSSSTSASGATNTNADEKSGESGGRGGGGGGRDGSSRDRTNSSDPKMIRSRVFVGHLNTDKCSRSELEELFSPFGKVTSCSLQHGYGFVQYHDEQAANRAITELHGLQFKGMKLGMTPVGHALARRQLWGVWHGLTDYMSLVLLVAAYSQCSFPICCSYNCCSFLVHTHTREERERKE